MSASHFMAHGDMPLSDASSHAAWACTGCMACRTACDHENDVAGTLAVARAALFERGVLPEAVRQYAASLPALEEEERQKTTELFDHPMVRADSPYALFFGCGYVTRAPETARKAITVASALLRSPVSLVQATCGHIHRQVGDGQADAYVARFRKETRRARTIVVVDPECGRALRQSSARGVGGAELTLLIELAERSLDTFGTLPISETREPVRVHDGCQLGRGLGQYDAPRRVLSKILGRAPDELLLSRERALCCGAGGLLPITMPAVARTIGRTLLELHRESGGGALVSTCPGAAAALADVGLESASDIVTWLDRGLAVRRATETPSAIEP
jgi:Fe-S oxidoreductase